MEFILFGFALSLLLTFLDEMLHRYLFVKLLRNLPPFPSTEISLYNSKYFLVGMKRGSRGWRAEEGGDTAVCIGFTFCWNNGCPNFAVKQWRLLRQ